MEKRGLIETAATAKSQAPPRGKVARRPGRQDAELSPIQATLRNGIPGLRHAVTLDNRDWARHWHVTPFCSASLGADWHCRRPEGSHAADGANLLLQQDLHPGGNEVRSRRPSTTQPKLPKTQGSPPPANQGARPILLLSLPSTQEELNREASGGGGNRRDEANVALQLAASTVAGLHPAAVRHPSHPSWFVVVVVVVWGPGWEHLVCPSFCYRAVYVPASQPPRAVLRCNAIWVSDEGMVWFEGQDPHTCRHICCFILSFPTR